MVAKLVERLVPAQKVHGSNPINFIEFLNCLLPFVIKTIDQSWLRTKPGLSHILNKLTAFCGSRLLSEMSDNSEFVCSLFYLCWMQGSYYFIKKNVTLSSSKWTWAKRSVALWKLISVGFELTTLTPVHAQPLEPPTLRLKITTKRRRSDRLRWWRSRRWWPSTRARKTGPGCCRSGRRSPSRSGTKCLKTNQNIN